MPRTVLVTGGARRIGAAVCRSLAAAGHRVVVHHLHSHDEAEALAAELGQGAVAMHADLADAGEVGTLIAGAAAAVGEPIDGLVNCASQFEYDSPATIDPVLMQRLIQVNLTAPSMLAAALAAQPGLVDGAVVNVLDQKIANPNPDFFSYSCTKFALAGATEMLAQALAPVVRVNAVAPGLTLPSADQTAEEFAAVARENLLQRPIAAEDIGRAVEFLLSTPSITGQTIFVDCGQRFLKRDSDVMFETRR